MSADITVLAANHVQGTLEREAGAGGLILWRLGCSCGHRGMWCSSPGYAIEAHARHYNRASR
jgi:hypothetical protein